MASWTDNYQEDPFELETRTAAYINVSNFDDLKKLKEFIISDQLDFLRKPSVLNRYYQERIKNQGNQKPYAQAVRDDVFYSDNFKILFSDKIALVKNPFPGNLPKDTEHWNIWFDMKDVCEDLLEEVKNFYFQKMNWSEENVVIWEKQLRNRSVPEIRHWHLYVKVG